MFIRYLAEQALNIVKSEKKPRRNIQYKDMGDSIRSKALLVLIHHQSKRRSSNRLPPIPRRRDTPNINFQRVQGEKSQQGSQGKSAITERTDNPGRTTNVAATANCTKGAA